MKYEIVNNKNLDRIKENFRPPLEIRIPVAERIVEGLGLSVEDLQKYIFDEGEVLDGRYYWVDELCKFIKSNNN